MSFHDWHVVVTRAATQSTGFEQAVKARGFSVTLVPTIETKRLQPDESGRELLADLAKGRMNWLVFTSGNGVEALAALLNGEARRQAFKAGLRVAVQGEATHEVYRALFRRDADLMPRQFVAEGLAGAFEGVQLAKQRVLLAVALETRGVLEQRLAARGAVVSRLPLYRTVSLPISRGLTTAIAALPAARRVVTLFSPSALQSFAASPEALEVLRASRIASIGPITSQALRAHRLEPWVEAKNHTAEGLLEALCARCLEAVEPRS